MFHKTIAALILAAASFGAWAEDKVVYHYIKP